MKILKRFAPVIICGLAWYGSVFSQPMAYAEDSFGDDIDCTDVSIYYVDDPNLTHEERLRLMDKAFWESLNKFEKCQSARERAKAAAAKDGGETGGSGETGDSGEASGASKKSAGQTGSALVDQSVASSTMSGTLAPEDTQPDEATESVATDGGENSQDKNATGSKTGGNMKRSSGKLPEDIPSAQNDDALAAQIRYAAENETDPEKSRQLWNEYRKYKGLPTK